MGPLFTRGCALDVDAAANVYVAGLVNGRGAFLGEPLPALYTALVASWTADGTRRWVRLLGGAGGAEAMALSIAIDEVRVLGYARGGLEGSAGLGNGDVFFARLDAALGTPRGVQILGGPDEDLPVGLQGDVLAWLTTRGILGDVSSTQRVPMLPGGLLGAALEINELVLWGRGVGDRIDHHEVSPAVAVQVCRGAGVNVFVAWDPREACIDEGEAAGVAPRRERARSVRRNNLALVEDGEVELSVTIEEGRVERVHLHAGVDRSRH